MFVATGIAPKSKTLYCFRGLRFTSSVGRGDARRELFVTDVVWMKADPKYHHMVTSY